LFDVVECPKTCLYSSDLQFAKKRVKLKWLKYVVVMCITEIVMGIQLPKYH